MEPLIIPPSLDPLKVPRAHLKMQNVPLRKLAPEPKPRMIPVPLKSAGKAYKTKKPLGFVLPILPVGPASEYRD